MACCWATKVVDAAEQPLPGPLRFCNVTMAAWIRVIAEAVELSAGKEIGTERLFTTFWTATLAFRD